jgi:hypothetical protein
MQAFLPWVLFPVLALLGLVWLLGIWAYVTWDPEEAERKKLDRCKPLGPQQRRTAQTLTSEHR